MPMSTITDGLHEIELAKIIPTPDNNRRIDPESQDIKDLAKSIAEMGVLQPVLVRPHPELSFTFDLRCGARRYHAAKLAGLETIPCVVRPMTDHEAMAATVVENLQRQDLSILEEADGVQKMLDAGWDVDAIAREIGRERGWVYRRAQLSKLTPEWKAEMLKTDPPVDEDISYRHRELKGIHHWGAAHLEEVARLPAEVQGRVLKHYTEKYYGGIPTLGHVRGVIGDLTRQLKKAPFDIEAMDLVRDAGPCMTCPKRQGATPDLFGLVEAVEAKADTCLDGACYERKILAHGRQKLHEARAKEPETLEVRMPRYQPYDSRSNGRKILSGKGADYEKVKKGTEGAIPAVIVSKEGAGQKTYVKKLKDRPARGSDGKVVLTVGMAREELAKEREMAARKEIAKQVEAVAMPELKTLLRLILLLGVQEDWRMDAKEMTRIEKLGRPDLLQEVWEKHLKAQLLHGLTNEYIDAGPMLRFAAMLGIEARPYLEQAEKDLPEPASWAGLKNSAPAPAKTEKPKKARRKKAEAA